MRASLFKAPCSIKATRPKRRNLDHQEAQLSSLPPICSMPAFKWSERGADIGDKIRRDEDVKRKAGGVREKASEEENWTTPPPK